jgi:uncharacterized protein YjiS (DUF1127 family)
MTAFAVPALGRVATFPSAKLGEFRHRFRVWAEQRRTIRRVEAELSTMTPRELADLGLCRSDISEVARGRFRR